MKRAATAAIPIAVLAVAAAQLLAPAPALAEASTADTAVVLSFDESAYPSLLSQTGGGEVARGSAFDLEAAFSGCPEGSAYLWEVSLDGGETWTALELDSPSLHATASWPVDTRALYRITATNPLGLEARALFEVVCVAAAGAASPQTDDPNGSAIAVMALAALSAGTAAAISRNRFGDDEDGER